MQSPPKTRLTAPRIAEAICPDGMTQTFIWDAVAPGLGLRVTPGGRKTFIYQSRLAGKSIRVTIGTAEVWTIGDARKQAAVIQTEIDAGRDPRVVKAERTAADAEKAKKAKYDAAPALEAWTEYIKARTPKWSARHKADHETMAREGGEEITRGRRPGMSATKEPGILRPLLVLPLKDITRDRVAAWLDNETEQRPTRARLAVSLLGAFLRWCGDRPEYRDAVNPDACARMKREIPPPQVKEDCLQREQLRLWFDAVRRISNPVISAYLQVLLLTGARREEIARLQWADVDLEWHGLTIRDKAASKGGQDGTRTLPLTPYVKTLLLDLKRATANVRPINGKPTDPPPWVFPSRSTTGYIAEPRIAHNKALAAAGLPPLSLHGLRRSFGTLAEWTEAPTGIVAQIMGHKPSAIAEKHYRRRPLDLLRLWHTKIEAWILEQAGIEQPETREQAVPLRAVGGEK